MNIATVMDGLGTRLSTISGLRVHAYMAENVQVPAAIVGMPESYTYDETMARGADRVTFPITVVVAKMSDRMARNELAAYLDGSGGAKSIKAAVEAASIGADSHRVTSVSVTIFTLSGIDYLGATFLVDVIG